MAVIIAVGAWCRIRSIAYTRYCDDMTFSGDFSPRDVILLVKTELAKLGFFLNCRKAIVIRRGRRQTVTGIVVNGKAKVPSEYRKRLRQELYYIKKFGLCSHMERIGTKLSEDQYLLSLLGRISYALSIDGDGAELRDYKNWLNSLRGQGW